LESLSQLLQERQRETTRGLYFGNQFTSYAELLDRASHQASALLERQVEAVVLVADNSPELVMGLLAAWWAGCVPVCLPPPARLQNRLTYQSLLQACLDRVPAGRMLVCGARAQRHLPEPQNWTPLPLPEKSQPAPLQPARDLAYLQFSSGTTRHPRATALSHANICHNLEAMATKWPGDRRRHSCVSWLPLYHDMGLIGCLLGALYAPGNLSLMTPTQFALHPGEWLNLVSQRQATISAAPNFALEFLLQRDTESRDLSKLEMLLLGGETIRAQSLRRFFERYRDQGLKWESLIPVYGLAEATLGVTFSQGPELRDFELPPEIGMPVRPGSRSLVSLGRPLPGVEVSLRDQQGQPLPEGHLGQIHVAGPGLAQALASPYPSGDLGFVWQQNLYFVGRLKDVLIYHGRNHDPEVVEELLHPLACAAVALEEPSQTFVCLVECPSRELPQTLEQEVNQKLALAPLPVRGVVKATGWLPRTSSGKISRYQARQKFAQESVLEPD